VEAEDTYFGKTYKDPYRWLENLKDKEVEAWFKAQGEVTDGLLGKIPGRDALVDEWMALDKLKPASYSAISYENGRVFYKKTLGGENHARHRTRRQRWEHRPNRAFHVPLTSAANALKLSVANKTIAQRVRCIPEPLRPHDTLRHH